MEIATDQFATEYVRLEHGQGVNRLVIQGDSTTPLLPVEVGDGCWWSNIGDVIDTTLTASVDLSNAAAPHLAYEVWHSIEEDWDYTYVEVSQRRGKYVDHSRHPVTSSDDPLNVSFGPGYTGKSEGWREESIPLARWAGQEIMVRFQYITDAAIHDHGLCLRDLRITTDGGAVDNDELGAGRVFLDRKPGSAELHHSAGLRGQGASEDNRVEQVPLDGINRAVSQHLPGHKDTTGGAGSPASVQAHPDASNLPHRPPISRYNRSTLHRTGG